jgi:uncharacterized protein (TIGR02001 family)
MTLKYAIAAVIAGPIAAFIPAAHADDEAGGEPHAYSSNVAVVSQYVFRGLAQTNERPALQGGFDYSHASGAYLGTWFSNVNWVADVIPEASASLEADFYAGYRKSWQNGIRGDVGYLRYQYPGSYPVLPLGTVKPHSDEAYAAVGWKWFNLKYSHSLGDLFGVEDGEGSGYVDLTMTIPLAASLSLVLHAGQQSYEGASAAARLAGTDNDALFGYEDYRATLNYAFADGWTASATVTTTTAKDAGYLVRGSNLGDDQLVIAILKSL